MSKAIKDNHEAPRRNANDKYVSMRGDIFVTMGQVSIDLPISSRMIFLICDDHAQSRGRQNNLDSRYEKTRPWIVSNQTMNRGRRLVEWRCIR